MCKEVFLKKTIAKTSNKMHIYTHITCTHTHTHTHTSYIKATNRLQYLHYTPSHPEPSQALRLCCICSIGKDSVKYSFEMKSWFLNRRYPRKLEEIEMKKVVFLIQRIDQKKATKKGVPLVIKFYQYIWSELNRIL